VRRWLARGEKLILRLSLGLPGMSTTEARPDKAFDLVVVGELNADLILRGEVIPEY
jgi:hypothetical protein